MIRDDIDNIIRSNRQTPAGDVTDLIFERLGLTDKEIEALETGELRVATKDQTLPALIQSLLMTSDIVHLKEDGWIRCVPKDEVKR